MSITNEPLLDAPIPGQSLTSELGGRPWQQPSEMKTVEDAIDYYIPRLGDPSQINNTLRIIDSGAPLTTIAEILTISGTMEGKHNVDVAVLVNPVIVEFLKGLGDMAGIKYTMDSEDDYVDKNVTELDALDAENSLIKEDVNSLMDDVMDMDDIKEEPSIIEEQAEDEPKGLMARRTM